MQWVAGRKSKPCCSNFTKKIDNGIMLSYNINIIKSVLFQGGVKVSTGSIRALSPIVCEPQGMMGENPNRRL